MKYESVIVIEVHSSEMYYNDDATTEYMYWFISEKNKIFKVKYWNIVHLIK